MPRRLIINADDYGRTPGVSAGIRCAYQNGIVTSTSALMTRAGIAGDLELAQRECPGLEIGVHLVCTSGPSLLPPELIPTLTSGTPGFRGLGELTDGLEEISLAEAAAEWTAQVERFVSLTGKAPGHLDAHHHFSYFREDFFEVMASLASRYGCPVRVQVAPPGCRIGGVPEHLLERMHAFVPRVKAKHGLRSPDYFYDGWYDEDATMSGLLSFLATLPEGSTTEIMCHPGYADAGLLGSVDGSVYNHQRESELEILTDPRLKAFLRQAGIDLIDFGSIGQ